MNNLDIWKRSFNLESRKHIGAMMKCFNLAYTMDNVSQSVDGIPCKDLHFSKWEWVHINACGYLRNNKFYFKDKIREKLKLVFL